MDIYLGFNMVEKWSYVWQKWNSERLWCSWEPRTKWRVLLTILLIGRLRVWPLCSCGRRALLDSQRLTPEPRSQIGRARGMSCHSQFLRSCAIISTGPFLLSTWLSYVRQETRGSFRVWSAWFYLTEMKILNFFFY